MEDNPWLSVNVDNDGTSTVFAKAEHLQNFSHFMKCIVENCIGKEQGFFKISVERDSSSSSLDDMLQFVRSSLGLKKFQTKVKVQTMFQSSSMSDHVPNNLYGVRVDVRGNFSANKRNNKCIQSFLRNAYDSSSYENRTSCCSQALNQSVTNVYQHFWDVLRNSDEPILYGSGIPLEDMTFNIAHQFSLSKLNTILDLLPNPIPGIASPYLYVGGLHSAFPWHIEDGAAFSINYLHYGAPCIWSFVQPRFYKQFETSSHYFPLDAAQVTCFNALGHKYIMADKDYLNKFDIPIHTVMQQEKELIVIYPFTPHSGFRTGYSLSEAANFGDPFWVELGILAPSCVCYKSYFKMDLGPIIAHTKPHLLEMYMKNDMGGLFNVLKHNQYIQELKLLPPSGESSQKSTEDQASSLNDGPLMETEDILVNEIRSKKLIPKKSKVKSSQIPHEENERNDNNGEDIASVSKGRCTLKCPGCKKTYTGGIGRLDRLEGHIMKKHGGNDMLLKKLKIMYPPKEVMNGLLCLVCNKVFSGNMHHLQKHMIRKHSSGTV